MVKVHLQSATLLCFTSLVYSTKADDDHNVNALSYNADIFAAEIPKNKHFVMFYAPWCGYCKNLNPTWNELAKVYNVENSPLIIAKVDCTIHIGFCADHNILGFPTLTMFDIGGEQRKRYKGRRDHQSLTKFIQNNIQDIGSPPAFSEDKEADALEIKYHQKSTDYRAIPEILTDDNFEEHVAKGYYFIEFFAPWCGHCKKLAPTWDELAATFNNDNKVTIAKVDCTEQKIICKLYGINGYPTLLWFKDGEQIDRYQGPRVHESLKDYISSKLLMAKEQEEDGAESHQDSNKDPDSHGKVRDLSDKTFQSHLLSSNLVFVKFFTPWCQYCQQLAPIWEELAEALADQPVSIAKVDCSLYSTICDKNQVSSYPTLKLFHNGQHVKDFGGYRSVDRLQSFVMEKIKEQHDEL